MGLGFKKQDMLDLAAETAPVLTKLNKCYEYKKKIKGELSEALNSEFAIKQFAAVMQHDFTSEASLTENKDIVYSCPELFELLYQIQNYRTCGIEALYENYMPELQDAIDVTTQVSKILLWVFMPAHLKNRAVKGYQMMMGLRQSADITKIEAIYEWLHSMSYSVDTIIDSYQKNSADWNQIVTGLLRPEAPVPSEYIKKSKILAEKFARIVETSFSDSFFRVEMDTYRYYVKPLIVHEKTKGLDLDTYIYTELKKIPIEDLNRTLPKIRSSALAQYGFRTMADVYGAPVQAIAVVKGISKEKAQQIKYIVNTMADTLKTNRRTEKKPLQLNYDAQTRGTTEIVKLIYNYRRFIDARKSFARIEQFDKSKIESAVKVLESFYQDGNLQHDINWLFLDVAQKQAIVNAYQYLDSLLNDERFEVYAQLFSYRHKDAASVDAETAWEDFRDNNVAYLNCIESLVPDAFEDEVNTYGLPEEIAEEIDKEPIYLEDLTCELRRYQLWGVKYIIHQRRALLGDEMGLGKTIQAIAAMVSLKDVGFNQFIVICPASVVINWYQEVRKNSRLQAYVGHGTSVVRDEAVNSWKYHEGVLITTYDTYATLDISDEDLKTVGMVVVDEAHYIKNADAARSKNIRGLCSKVERVVFLTGTPMENKVDEMLSLIDVLNPEVADKARNYAHITVSQQFKDAVAPVYFRRKQCDVNKELPEKIETTDWCRMNAAEYDSYDKVVLQYNKPFMPMRRVSWNVSDIRYSSKAQALKGIVNEAVNEGRKVIVFSFFKDTLDRVRQLFEDQCTDIINGSVSPAKRQEIIDTFSKSKTQHVLVSQIQAGGTGLNIQAASVVVMCEPQIKPSIENQAIGRAHRMGQSRNVIVHRLCCIDSIDERMMKILDRKKVDFKAFADRSVAGDESLDLSEDDSAVKTAIEEEIQAAKERQGKVDNKNIFRESAEGKEWHDTQEAEAKLTAVKMQSQGRQRTVGTEQRYRILMRDNYTCQKCGRYGPGARDKDGHPLPEPEDGYAVLEVDHMIPFSLGGSDDDSNLQTLCEKCNRGKSNKYIDAENRANEDA